MIHRNRTADHGDHVECSKSSKIHIPDSDHSLDQSYKLTFLVKHTLAASRVSLRDLSANI